MICESMHREVLLAIDPGDVESAFCFIDIDTYEPLYFKKEINSMAMDDIVEYIKVNNVTNAAIEMVASYGMSKNAT